MFPDLELPAQAPGPHRLRVFGHERAQALLRSALARDRLAHAWLLAGPPEVGKRTLARWLAQVLHCSTAEPAAKPCGHCRACRLVAARGWPDLHELEAPLRIGAVRELQHDLALAPNASPYRVAILPEVELASAGAANCLLKTLEEPPAYVRLILTTADPGAVLPTVRSRCQILSLRPLPVALAAEALAEEWSAEAPQAALLAGLSGGRLGWAARALTDAGPLERRETWLSGLARARAAGLAERMTLAAELARVKEGVAEGLAVWLSWWRDVLLAAHGLGEALVNEDRRPEIEAAARHHGPGPALGFLRHLETAGERLKANAGPQLTLEVLLLELP